MQHEKIIRRQDGSEITLGVNLDREHNYVVMKKDFMDKYTVWVDPVEDFATPEEILSAKLELWQKLKPE